MFGPQSPNWLLITGPRLTAGSQSLSSEARCETQMSFPPCPPGLFEQKYRLSASGESVGPCSLKAVLTASPRRTGGDQSSWANFIIEIIETSALAVGGARTDDEWSAPHPTSSNSVDSGNAANCRMRLMRTSACRLPERALRQYRRKCLRSRRRTLPQWQEVGLQPGTPASFSTCYRR